MPAGKHADQRTISFSPPDMTEQEISEVAEALRSGWITTGPRTKELERRLAKYCGLPASNLVCLNSCTAAEELNLRILGVGSGDEVIVPAYTYTATAAAAIHAGARVVFVDSQPDSAEMDYDRMEEAVTPRTKAVIPVDIGGVPCDYDRIFSAVQAKRRLFRPGGCTESGRRIQESLGRVAVAADCAHSFGSSYHGKMAGAAADFSSFSFHAVKNLTTGEGGAACWRDIPGMDSREIYRIYQLYSLHGQDKDALAKTQAGAWEYDIVAPWYKYNMTDIAAAVGLKQLERYAGLLRRRREIISRYDRACDELGIRHVRHAGAGWTSCGHLYLTWIPWASDGQRRAVIRRMAERGVAANVHYKPLPMMTAYRNLGWRIEDFPNAYALYKNEVTLPLHTKLSDDDVEYVVQVFTDAVEKEAGP